LDGKNQLTIIQRRRISVHEESGQLFNFNNLLKHCNMENVSVNGEDYLQAYAVMTFHKLCKYAILYLCDSKQLS